MGRGRRIPQSPIPTTRISLTSNTDTPAKAGIQRGGRGGSNHTEPLPAISLPFSYLGVPAAAGMNDCHDSMSRTPVRDRPPPPTLSFRPPNSSFQRKLESRGAGSRHTFAGPAPFHFHPLVRPSQGHWCSLRMPESRGGGVAQKALKRFQQPAPFSYLCVPAAAGVQRWGGENVALGLVPSPGGARPAHTTIPHPNHPNILDIQHRYSGEGRNPADEWGGTNRTRTFPTTNPIYIPWSAGPGRHRQLLWQIVIRVTLRPTLSAPWTIGAESFLC